MDQAFCAIIAYCRPTSRISMNSSALSGRTCSVVVVSHAIHRIAFLCLSIVLVACSVSCTRVPEGLQPVTGFDVNRYLGKWFEIARLDHSFERGLQNVTAEYSMNDDGSIRVLNRGYNPRKASWEEAEGTAKFIGDPRTGSLKVSFFGPFYGGYHVLAIDHDYRYAMLTGPSRAYLWILAREDHLPDDVLQGLIHQADVWGFKTDKIIRISHAPPEQPAKSTAPSSSESKPNR